MKYEEIMKLSKTEIEKLPRSEIIEALEDYADKEFTIFIDDSKIKF